MNSDTPTIDAQEEIRKLKKINSALMERVERSMDQQGSAYSLFQTAINLEGQVKRRTSELTATLAHLEKSNLELKNAISDAEKANLSKTRFLAAASHDVLQPLNAATLLINSLSTIQTCDEGKRLCTQANRSLENMDTLLRTLLYMSRLDAGDIEPVQESVPLRDIFSSIASVFQPIAAQKKLTLRIRDTDLHVHSDPNLLRRIVQNIVSNAIRYTASGGVLLGATQVGRQVLIESVESRTIAYVNTRARQLFSPNHGCSVRHNANQRLRAKKQSGENKESRSKNQQQPYRLTGASHRE